MNNSMPYDGVLSLDRLLELHARGLREHKGPEGILNPGCPEATLAAAWQAADYAEIGDSLPHLVFGCYLLYYFGTKQCFADGNKRIGWLSLCEVLATLNLEVDATTDEAYGFCMNVARGQVRNIDDIVRWVGSRLRELQPLPKSSTGSSPSSDEPGNNAVQQAKLIL